MAASDLHPDERPHNWIALLLLLTATYFAGFVGSFAANDGLSFWYLTLAKPSWSPPPGLFAPVWTILYFLIGWGIWQVWESPPSRARTVGIGLYFTQLLLNGLWPWLFFGWHKVLPALFEISALCLCVLCLVPVFQRARRGSGLILLPYLGWLAFMAELNFEIHAMNR